MFLFRSISLVGENDRKLLKDVIKANPERTLKQRQVAPGISLLLYF